MPSAEPFRYSKNRQTRDKRIKRKKQQTGQKSKKAKKVDTRNDRIGLNEQVNRC